MYILNFRAIIKKFLKSINHMLRRKSKYSIKATIGQKTMKGKVRNKEERQGTIRDMVDINPTKSVITVSINGLSKHTNI